MESTIVLNHHNLAHFADRISCPVYSRNELKTGIVHIGVGGFHRAHQAYYMHQLHEKINAAEWGICGIGIRAGDRKIYEVLKKQDYLYTLVIRHPDGKIESQVVGSLVDFLLGVDQPGEVIDRMANPATKIVSLTITDEDTILKPRLANLTLKTPISNTTSIILKAPIRYTVF